jgi:hypothetical protein
MAEIEHVEAWKFNGKLYETEAKAVEAAETKVYDYLKPFMLGPNNMTVSESVKVMQLIFDHRQQLLRLLDY